MKWDLRESIGKKKEWQDRDGEISSFLEGERQNQREIEKVVKKFEWAVHITYQS
jgi:hypothetical protein